VALDQIQLVRISPVSGYSPFAVENSWQRATKKIFHSTQGTKILQDPVPYRQPFDCSLPCYAAYNVRMEFSLIQPTFAAGASSSVLVHPSRSLKKALNHLRSFLPSRLAEARESLTASSQKYPKVPARLDNFIKLEWATVSPPIERLIWRTGELKRRIPYLKAEQPWKSDQTSGEGENFVCNEKATFRIKFKTEPGREI